MLCCGAHRLIWQFLDERLQHGKEGYALVSLQCACRVVQELAWGEGMLRGASAPADDDVGGVDVS